MKERYFQKNVFYCLQNVWKVKICNKHYLVRAGNDFGLLGIKRTQNLFGVRICFKKYSSNLINVLSCGKVVGSATLISKRNDAIPFKHGSPCIKYQVIFLLFAGSLHWLLSCDIPTVLCPITPVPLKSPNDGIFYHKIFWPFVIHLLCCLPDPAAFQITEGCCIKLELVYNDVTTSVVDPDP